jgi:hypothetical protein
MPRPTATPATPAAEPSPLQRLLEELGLRLPPDGSGFTFTCPLHDDHPIERRTNDEKHRHCHSQP